MRTMKLSELAGNALDWVVAKCEGWDEWDWDNGEFPAFTKRHGVYSFMLLERFRPSSCWAIAGPIIEREGITIIRCDDAHAKGPEGFTTTERVPVWCATTGQHSPQESTEHQQHDAMYQIDEDEVMHGPTPLIAAMRCYVASKLGRVVDVPQSF